MRHCYLVCYDIRDPKRLRSVFQLLKGFGEHWQYSVFFCVLKDIDRVRLQVGLENRMNLREDRALIIHLGRNEKETREAITSLGESLPPIDDGMVLV